MPKLVDRIEQLRILKAKLRMFFDGSYDMQPINSIDTFNCGIVKYKYNYDKNILTIYCRRPGLVIGHKGVSIDKLKSYLGVEIHIVEITDLFNTP